MYILAILLPLIGGGSAVTGNPARPFTDEQKIKAVIGRLEEGIENKDEVLIIDCLSGRVSTRETKEVEADFNKHVASTQALEGKPLVCLQNVQVEIDGNKAVAEVEMFSYGNGKRIKAVHRIPFRRDGDIWRIGDAQSLTSILQQLGGIIPQQQSDTPKGNETPKVEIAPVEPVEDNLDTDEPKVKVIPADAAPVEDVEDRPAVETSEVEVLPPVESETTNTEDSE